MPKKAVESKPAPRPAVESIATRASGLKKVIAYEPPTLTKFDKLDKLIVCGE